MKPLSFFLFIILCPLVSFAQSDKEIVAATLIMEAGGERAVGAMEAVCEVLTTRAMRRHTTPAREALRAKQFSCWNGLDVAKGVEKAKRHPRWGRAYLIASSLPTNYAKGADHYYSTSMMKKPPYWASSMKKTVDIGNHAFYSSRK